MTSAHFFEFAATASLHLDGLVAAIEEMLVGKGLVIEDAVVFQRGRYALLGSIDKTILILLVTLLVSFARIGDREESV